MRRSHPYLRENKKIANNWRHFIISTQTGSHEKSRISLIHFCSNIHSFTVLDYTGIQVYTYHLKYLYWLSIYSFDDYCIQCIFIWLVRFFSSILLANFFLKHLYLDFATIPQPLPQVISKVPSYGDIYFCWFSSRFFFSTTDL